MAATNKNITFDVNLLPATTENHNLGSSNLKWNLFVNQINGTTPVTGIKGNSENNYRTGQVNLTPENLGAVAKDAELLTTNPFAPSTLRGPYISKIDNAFYAADKRWNITATNNSNNLPRLFDGNYDTWFNIAQDASTTITMDFSNVGHFPGYPYGYILVSFYHTFIPANITGRVYCDWESQGIGWHDLTFSQVDGSDGSHLVYKARQSFYNITTIEITITASSSTITYINQIEMHLDRPDSSRTPFLSKYGPETLYYNLTAPKFIGPLEGNATTATEFSSGTTVKLTGDITGESSSSKKGWSLATTIGESKVTNAMLAGSIANGKLANSSIKIGNKTISLGGTATLADIGVSYPVTGVKGNSENSYRTGQINLTAANVGAVAISGDTMTGSLIVGNLTDDVQRVINLRTSAGRIVFVSDGANDTRGIYLANADDSKHGYALTFDQDNQININYKTFFTYPILFKKDLDYSATRAESVTMPMVQVLDKNNLVRHQIYAGLNTANTAYTYLAVRDGTHSTYIGTTLDSSGNSTYEISHPVAFRNALGASSGAWPVSLGGTGTTTFTAGAALIGNGTNAITTRSITNLTTSGGSVTANTNLITANTLVNYAVKKAGDTITGSLYLTMNQVSSQINFGCTAWSYGSGTNLRDYIAETSWGTIHYDLPYVLTNQSKTLFSGQHIFTQKSPTTSGSPTNYSEYYRLPLTTAGRSSNAFYDIITTKNREDIVVASGIQTVGTIGANNGGTVTVNFSPTLSNTNYIVIVTPVVGTVNVGVQNLKTNSFDAYYRNTSGNSATANFKWAILKL